MKCYSFTVLGIFLFITLWHTVGAFTTGSSRKQENKQDGKEVKALLNSLLNKLRLRKALKQVHQPAEDDIRRMSLSAKQDVIQSSLKPVQVTATPKTSKEEGAKATKTPTPLRNPSNSSPPRPDILKLMKGTSLRMVKTTSESSSPEEQDYDSESMMTVTPDFTMNTYEYPIDSEMIPEDSMEPSLEPSPEMTEDELNTIEPSMETLMQPDVYVPASPDAVASPTEEFIFEDLLPMTSMAPNFE